MKRPHAVTVHLLPGTTILPIPPGRVPGFMFILDPDDPVLIMTVTTVDPDTAKRQFAWIEQHTPVIRITAAPVSHDNEWKSHDNEWKLR